MLGIMPKNKLHSACNPNALLGMMPRNVQVLPGTNTLLGKMPRNVSFRRYTLLGMMPRNLAGHAQALPGKPPMPQNLILKP